MILGLLDILICGWLECFVETVWLISKVIFSISYVSSVVYHGIEEHRGKCVKLHFLYFKATNF